MRPETSEFTPCYAEYVALVPDGEIGYILTDQFDETVALLRRTTPEQEVARYAEGTWSVREALGRTGVASRVKFTVRSFFWIVAGHELHHRDLFAERYGIS